MAAARRATAHSEALDSLARAIGKHRTTDRPRDIARELPAVDNPSHTHLVGVDYAATRAVFFHRSTATPSPSGSATRGWKTAVHASALQGRSPCGL